MKQDFNIAVEFDGSNDAEQNLLSLYEYLLDGHMNEDENHHAKAITS